MFEGLLRQVGLTDSEIAVYVALVTLGSSTSGPIVKEAGISSGKIYEILGKLIERGLATYIISSGRKYFSPTSPFRLLDLVEKAQSDLARVKQEMREVVDYFDVFMKERGPAQKAEIFEGEGGYKTFCDFALKTITSKTKYGILGVSKEVNARFGAYNLEWQKKRAKRKIHLRAIYNADAMTHGGMREKLSCTAVRYLPPAMKTPALIELFDDYVATVIITPKPIVFLIRSKEAAESYRSYFELMWNLARKP